MPRKLLSDSYRGWYGWEAQTNSLLRMSNCSMWECRQKLDQEKFRHQLHMERLRHDQKLEEETARKAYRSLQDEYSRIRAEQRVLQYHAFSRYDHSLRSAPQPSLPRPKSNLLPARPETERAPAQAASSMPTDRPPVNITSSSLPSIVQPDRNRNSKNDAKTASKDKPLSLPATVGPKVSAADRLRTTAAKRSSAGRTKGKRKRQSSTTSDSSLGSVFLTQSSLIKSKVMEEGQEDIAGEDEVFYVNEHPTVDIFVNESSTSEANYAGRGSVSRLADPAEEVLDRPGHDPREDSFHNIDYILGARKSPLNASGTVTSTHFAKPSTPKSTAKRNSSAKRSPDVTDPTLQHARPIEDLSANFGQGKHLDRTEQADLNSAASEIQNTESSQSINGQDSTQPDVQTKSQTCAVVDPGGKFPFPKPKQSVLSRILSKQQPVQGASSQSSPWTTRLQNGQTETECSPKAPDAPDQAGGSTEAQDPPKMSLLSRFRQAAQTIVEEQRYERESNTEMFAALLLNRPQRQFKCRAIEKPAGVQEQENKVLWRDLLLNVQNAVRWKAKTLRENQGVPNTRQMRRKAREQQQQRERRHVFPGHCKTSYAMKKFLGREVDQLVEAWRPENRRKYRNRQLVKDTALPPFVDRVRSTTAILREFKNYQSQREKVQT